MKSLMKQYSQLTMNAKWAKRKKSKPGQPGFVYYENHHIWPKCFGRDDRNQNLVLLTFPEHVEAHILLAKLYPLHFGIQAAPDYLLSVRGLPVSVEVAAEAKLLASVAQSEKQKQEHFKGNLWLADQGESHPSKKQENRDASSQRMSIQVQCPHCCLCGQIKAMQRWHFANCKLLTNFGKTCNLPDPTANKLLCSDCNLEFQSEHGLKTHVGMKHRDSCLSAAGQSDRKG